MNHTEVFRHLKYGLFVHFVHPLSVFSDGRVPADINERLDSFDVEAFADSVARTGVQYLILTAWHFKANPIYPSAVTKKWRGIETANRDLLGEIIDAVTRRGVMMILYTHPRDGHDFTPEEQAMTGWGTNANGSEANCDTFDHDKWNAYTGELYAELFERYGKRISGIYTDGMGPYEPWTARTGVKPFQVVDYLMIRRLLKAQNPSAFMIQNYFGNSFCNDFIMPEGYLNNNKKEHEESPYTWPAGWKGYAMTGFNYGWLLSKKQEGDCRVINMEEMARFGLLQASCSENGGLCLAASTYCEGNIWGDHVLESLNHVGDCMRFRRDALLDAKPSLSYPTISGDTLQSLDFRFFMTSQDEKTEYMHLLRMPENGIIELNASLDSAVLTDPLPLTEGLRVTSFEKTAHGYRITVEGTLQNDHGIVAFARTAGNGRCAEWINDTDRRIRYSAHWEPKTTVFGCYETDCTVAEAAGETAFLYFEGDKLEIYGAGGYSGKADVYIDSILVGTADCAGHENNRDCLFSSESLGGGGHTLELVIQEGQFALDAVRVIR